MEIEYKGFYIEIHQIGDDFGLTVVDSSLYHVCELEPTKIYKTLELAEEAIEKIKRKIDLEY